MYPHILNWVQYQSIQASHAYVFYFKVPWDSSAHFHSELHAVLIVSETTAAKYLYVVNLTYSFTGFTISNCQTSLTAKLKQVIPTQTIYICVFAGGLQSIHFSVTDVQYTNIEFRSVSVYM